jgi:phosphoribosylglycinamide formyltransferase-1
MTARIAVGVSGAGSNLRALHAAAERRELGGDIVLVFADRACAALDWAAEHGVDTALVAGGDDEALAEALAGARPDVVVLAGYMRIVGPKVLEAYAGRIINTHPSLLPAFPGATAVRDAIEHGVRVTGVTVHIVDETLDGGPIVAQEPVPVLPDDDDASLRTRIQAVEHRLLPRAVVLLAVGALSVEPDGRHVTLTSTPPTPTCRCRVGRSCPCRTRPVWSTSGRAWSPADSNSCRREERLGRCETLACP